MLSQTQQVEKPEQQVARKPGVHFFSGYKSRFSSRRRGFSLVEILVVISIIALLVGIGTAAGIKMTSSARVEQTRAMMEGLLSANDEYKAVRQGTSISHTGPIANLSSVEQFVNACKTIKTCEEIMMAAVNSGSSKALERTFTDNIKSSPTNGYDTVYDRWGTELEYRPSNDQTGSGPNNTEGNAIANNLLPLSRDPFFASAGPDQEWGTDDDITTLEP